MSKSYRVVWSKSQGAFVVASELAKGNGKGRSGRSVLVRGAEASSIGYEGPVSGRGGKASRAGGGAETAGIGAGHGLPVSRGQSRSLGRLYDQWFHRNLLRCGEPAGAQLFECSEQPDRQREHRGQRRRVAWFARNSNEPDGKQRHAQQQRDDRSLASRYRQSPVKRDLDR